MPLVPFPALEADGTTGRTVAASCAQLTPPSVLLRWDPPGYGAAFVAYGVWRRPTRAPVLPFVKIGRIAVPAGDDPAVIEAQHHWFVDSEPGWHRDDGDRWTYGWDYIFTAENNKGLESLFSVLLGGEVVPFAGNAWLCSNAAPWLNSPLQILSSGDSTNDANKVVRRYDGRDLAVVRTPVELAPRVFTSAGMFMATVGPDQLRYLRAAEASGHQFSLLRQNGDVITGDLTVPKWSDAKDGAQFQDIQLGLTETSRRPALADYNLPCGLPLNGTNQTVKSPNAAPVDPGSGPFTVAVVAVFPTASGKVHLSKGPFAGPAPSYGIGNTSGTIMGFKINGTTIGAFPTPTDGEAHVVSASATPGAQQIYLDGDLVATASLSYTALSGIGASLVAGADNGGGALFSALDPYRGHAYWGRALTPTEHQLLAGAYLGWPGFRLPAGPVLAYDTRDDRCLTRGIYTLRDLSGNGWDAAFGPSPVFRGYPWPLSDLERF